MAFPTTGLLDDFNRANENPVNTNWAEPLIFGNGSLQIISNELAPVSGISDAYWSAATFGPDSECYALIRAFVALFNRMSVFARMTSPGVSGATNGYEVSIKVQSGADNTRLFRWDNSVATQLGSQGTAAFSVGDSMGIELIGSGTDNFKMYRHDGTSWSEVRSEDDPTYTAAGNIGAEISSSSGRFDDFSGGTVAVFVAQNLILSQAIQRAATY